ncbi:MAG TPA: hypothetical protein PLB55_18145 [Prosthecobacter sp.]|nr:hypothetical protein [Prosthecobacter sp.]
MKAVIPCLFTLAIATSMFAQVPLSGYDVFEVVKDASVPSTAFNFKSYITGESIRGLSALSPLITAKEVTQLKLEGREIGSAPCMGVAAKFHPDTKAKLLSLVAKNPTAEVMIAIDGVPKATYKADEFIELVEQGTSLFVIYQLKTKEEFEKTETLLKTIKSGQWTDKAKHSKSQL